MGFSFALLKRQKINDILDVSNMALGVDFCCLDDCVKEIVSADPRIASRILLSKREGAITIHRSQR